jgi:hypothetical protein
MPATGGILVGCAGKADMGKKKTKTSLFSDGTGAVLCKIAE